MNDELWTVQPMEHGILESEYLQEALASGLTRPFCILYPVWLPLVVSYGPERKAGLGTSLNESFGATFLVIEYLIRE